MVQRSSLTWRDDDSGHQENELRDEMSSSKTISVSEVDEEDNVEDKVAGGDDARQGTRKRVTWPRFHSRGAGGAEHNRMVM